jgi:hypothetical protein
VAGTFSEFFAQRGVIHFRLFLLKKAHGDLTLFATSLSLRLILSLIEHNRPSIPFSRPNPFVLEGDDFWGMRPRGDE